MPPNLFNWRPIVRQKLPFASRVVTSSNDPFASPERGRAMAADWGSALTELGPLGHLNGESGLADWPEGLALLAGLTDPVDAAHPPG